MRNRNILLLMSVIFSCFLFSALSLSQSKKSVDLYGGVSIPVNEFASTTGSDAGFAKFGYSICMDYELPIELPIDFPIGLLASLNVSVNSLDEKGLLKKVGNPLLQSQLLAEQQLGDRILNAKVGEYGSYYSVFILVGPEIQFEMTPEIILQGTIQGGGFMGTNPAYEALYSGGVLLSQDRATSSALAYSLAGGVQLIDSFVDNLNISVRYTYVNPQYDLTQSISGTRRSFSYQQPTSFILLLVGFGI